MSRDKRTARKPKSKSKTKKVAKTQKTSSKKQQLNKEKKQFRQIVVDYDLKDFGDTIKVKLHSDYEIAKEKPIYPLIKNYYKLFIQKEKNKNQSLYNISEFTYFPSFEFILANQKPQDQKCSICQFEFEQPNDYQKQLLEHNDEDVIALKCSHKMHWSCFKMLVGDKDWLKCPVCSMIYGSMIGDQPDGTMSVQFHKDLHCDGYPDCGTIVVDYYMKSGTRNGVSFSGTGRTAYLPDNKEGNQALELLRKAFDRKLIFTVGRSVTTGRDNQVVWNGVHHKTNTHGGSAYFGYPDDTYFDRLKLQLAAKGVY